MQDGRAQHRREFCGLLVPPFKQFQHQAGHVVRRWRHIAAHAYANCPVTPRFALIHYLAREDAMQFKNMIVTDALRRRVLFHWMSKL